MKQTIFRVSVAGGLAPVPTPTDLTETTNGQVGLPNLVSTVLLPALATRRFASIKNNTAATIFLRFANAAAVVTNYPLKPNEAFNIGPDTIFGLYRGPIFGIQASGVAVDVNVLEFI